MKNRMRKLLVLATAATLMTTAFTGCGSDNSSNADNNADTNTTSDASDNGSSNADLSGSISLAGSTSMEKLCEALKESFMEQNPNVSVTVEYTGSGAGIESVTAGSVDIGDSSRALTDDEKANGIEENIVAIDGIAVITDKDNSVTELTSDDLKKIYTGEITNWNELGGSDEAIVVIGREAASGTRGAFEELLDVKDQCKYAQELDSTGAVLAKVGSTPGAIGYVSLDVLDNTVTAMKLDGVEATEDNIVAGKYLLSRPFVMATKGKIDEQNDVVKAWFDYINSDAGKEVIKSVGLILPQ
ncbi:phosphate ABC transporter substrate-binding protein [Agathobacter sp.]